MRKTHLSFTLGMAIVALVSSQAAAGPLFSDDFNTVASAANYTQATLGVNSATFAYDYSAMGIPSSPSTTDNSTLGLKLESNNAQSGGTGVVSAITLHTVPQFTGNYRVLFDAWINANGPFPGGGIGSTEFLTAGVGGNGTTVNYGGGATTGSGGWTAVDGEGGSGIDYRMLKNAVLQAPSSGQYDAGTVDSPTASNSRNADDPYYSQFGDINVGDLPVQGANNGGPAQQNGTTQAGAFGFEWHEIELRVNAAGGTGGATSMEWFIDGLRIGKLDAGVTTSFSTDGRVTVGYYDPFAGRSDNVTLSFGVIDNLRVIPEPGTLALLAIGLIGLAAHRRRPR